MPSFLGKIMRDSNERVVKKYRSTVDEINSLEADLEGLSDQELAATTQEFRKGLKKAKTWKTCSPKPSPSSEKRRSEP